MADDANQASSVHPMPSPYDQVTPHAPDPSERAGEGLTDEERESLLVAIQSTYSIYDFSHARLYATVERILADRMAARAGEVAESDIEAVLAAHSFDGQRGGRQECRCRWRAEDTGSTRHRRHVAEMIASSGLVGGRADEARAEAWDEGYAACFDDSRYEPGYGRGNPYRIESGEAS